MTQKKYINLLIVFFFTISLLSNCSFATEIISIMRSDEIFILPPDVELTSDENLFWVASQFESFEFVNATVIPPLKTVHDKILNVNPNIKSFGSSDNLLIKIST